MLRSELAALLARREAGQSGSSARGGRLPASAAHSPSRDPRKPRWRGAVGRAVGGCGRSRHREERFERAAGSDTGRRPGPGDRLARAGPGARPRDDRRGRARRLPAGTRRARRVRASLGSSELRALATRHGDELARLALRRAARERAPHACWSGASAGARTRCPSPGSPSRRRRAGRDLAALRDTRRRLAERAPRERPTAATAGRRPRPARGGDPTPYAPPGGRVDRSSTRSRPNGCVAALDGTTFVELVDVDGVLHALVARSRHGSGTSCVGGDGGGRTGRRVRPFRPAPGRPRAAVRPGRRRPSARGGAARGRRPGAWATGPWWSRRPSRLHATPWSLLPALAGVPGERGAVGGAVAAGAGGAPSDGARVLVAGPGLESGGAEIDVLARPAPGGGAAAGRRRHGRAEPWRRWTARPSRTSRRTGASARTARCSPRSTSMTGR